VSRTVHIIGWGDSLDGYDWPQDVDLCVLSGAIYHVHRCPRYWVAMDRPEHYHAWNAMDDPGIEKHTNLGHNEWLKYPNVWGWNVRRIPVPDFDRDILSVSTGVYGNQSSILASLQIMAKRGYTKMVFIGCDFRNGYGGPIPQDLRIWHPHFQEAGIDWTVENEISLLADFLPTEVPCGAAD
jgi:hypothetical protein